MELRTAARIGEGRTAEVHAWGEGRVLKLFREWVPEEWVGHEARMTAAAHAAGAPAPAVHGLEQVGGRHGLVLERVDGPSLLELLRRQPWRVVQAARVLAELQARLHALRPEGMPRLEDALRWRIGSPRVPEPVRRLALEALARLPAGDRLCHSDLHPDNVILAARGPMVIDWAEAAAGDPLADVVRTSLTLRISAPEDRPLGLAARAGRGLLHATYLRRYRQLTGAAPAALAAWELPVAAARAGHGIEQERPALEELLARLAAPGARTAR